MNTFVCTQTSAFITHLLAHIPVAADIALDLITTCLLCPYLTKSNIFGRKNLNYRVSQAVSASKLLRPLLSHSSLPSSWKLTAYRSIVLSILTYAMDSALLSPSQIQKMNTVHFKSLRRVFKIKSSFYHRVLEPTNADCSNEYLAGLAYDIQRIPAPSQLYSQQRLQLLGHLYRHIDTLEYQVTFMGSHAYRHVLSRNRPGRPAHTGRNPASQRRHTASPTCSLMIRRSTPTFIMPLAVSRHYNRSAQRMAPALLSAWIILPYTGQYSHTPGIERISDASFTNPVLKGMHNYNPLK